MVAGPRDNGEARGDRVRKAASSGPGVELPEPEPYAPRFAEPQAGEPAFDEQVGESAAEELHPAVLAGELGEAAAAGELSGPEVEPQELRPRRKLRIWQLAPIVVFAALGSLMFAFPLAFEPGGSSGAVVSMLGLLLCGCAGGGAVVAARRVGHRWPGMPARGAEGGRPDWRVVALYAALFCTVVALAVLRIARLR